MTLTKTFEQVCDHAWFVEHNEFVHGSPFVTVLRGSQNYRLNDELSDVDTETIVVPSIYDGLLQKDRLSKTIEYPDGSHCGIRDIREMVSCWRKQNPTFLELLFSDYVRSHTLDTRYWKLWNELTDLNEDIAHMNPFRFVFSVAGQVENKYKAFDTDTPAHHPFLEQYGYVPKELSHMVRNYYILCGFLNGEDFSDCLILPWEQRNELLAIKRGKLDLKEAKELREEVHSHVLEMRANVAATTFDNENEKITKFLYDWTYKVFKLVNENEVKND